MTVLTNCNLPYFPAEHRNGRMRTTRDSAVGGGGGGGGGGKPGEGQERTTGDRQLPTIQDKAFSVL